MFEFRILGPIEVERGGSPIRIGGPRQRALLALLLLEANTVVSRDRLLDALHAGQDGDAADRALRVQISRLRAALENGDEDHRLVSRAPGYVLRVEPEELDLSRFERLAAEGQCAVDDAQPEQAVAALREAESLWRGRPLADFEYEDFARVHIERLEELRLAVTEQRIEAELAFGWHARLVPELEVLVDQHPHRERLRGLLMLVLYRSGRQADALAVYRAGRQLSVEELALEPGRELRELEQAILRQDAALDAPAAPIPGPRPRSPRRWAVAAAAAIVAIAVASTIALVSRGSKHAAVPSRLHDSGLVLVSTRSGNPVASVRLRAPASHIATGLGSLWVTESGANVVERIDPRARAVRQTIAVGGSPSGIAVAAGDVWVANTLDGTVSRIDGDTDTVVQRVPLGGQPSAVLAAAGSVWVANGANGTVSQIEPKKGKVVRVVRVGRGPSCLAAAAGTLWVCNQDDGTVTRIDMRTVDVLDTIRVGEAPSTILASGKAVWLLDRLGSTISRLDPMGDAVVETHAVGGRPSGMTSEASTVWVSNDRTGQLARLDPRTGTMVDPIIVGDHAGDVIASRDGLWVAVAPGGQSHRGGTLRLVETTYGHYISIDPAIQSNAPPLALQGLAYDGLVTLDHAAGPDGARLVPDIALSLPQPTDSGTTYTFRLRPGIRYSTGGTVRASDVRHSLERLFHPRVHSEGAHFFKEIIGARGCLRGIESRCNLSRGIVTDDALGAVTFHLTAPDPDFLFKLSLSFAAVLPASVPERLASSPLPATGPYMVRSAKPDRVLLVRNPRFREWSHAAQPSGYPDRIVSLTPRRASGPSLTVQGGADLTPVIGSLGSNEQRLRTRSPGLFRVNSFAATDFWFLNVRAKPFRDVRVRRALNYAVDRDHIAALWGGMNAALPTCQLLPPRIPGFVRHCPYSERGRNPNLARARQLVRESGTRGMRVTVWTTRDPRSVLDEGRYVAGVLRRLGYRARAVVLPDERFFAYTNDSTNRAQVVSGGWSADYSSASSFFGKLTCAFFVPRSAEKTTDAAELCDPGFDRRVAHAQSLQLIDPAAATAEWARLDRELTKRAIMVPTVNFRETDLLSPRVGNYQYHVLWGPIVDQLWVR